MAVTRHHNGATEPTSRIARAINRIAFHETDALTRTHTLAGSVDFLLWQEVKKGSGTKATGACRANQRSSGALNEPLARRKWRLYSILSMPTTARTHIDTDHRTKNGSQLEFFWLKCNKSMLVLGFVCVCLDLYGGGAHLHHGDVNYSTHADMTCSTFTH